MAKRFRYQHRSAKRNSIDFSYPDYVLVYYMDYIINKISRRANVPSFYLFILMVNSYTISVFLSKLQRERGSLIFRIKLNYLSGQSGQAGEAAHTDEDERSPNAS